MWHTKTTVAKRQTIDVTVGPQGRLVVPAPLRRRLGIEAGQIDLIEFRNVTWPDGSLGCPQPDMAYIQVLIEGYLIRLGVRAQVYEYHGSQNADPFLCQNPDQPAPGLTDS